MRRRFTLFGFGFALGILILLFFLNGKNASCDFLPNDRMLKILRNKHRVYSDEALQIMRNQKIDSAMITKILIAGDIDFSKSKTRQEPCRYYWVDGFIGGKESSLYVENCDTIVAIQHIYFDKE